MQSSLPQLCPVTQTWNIISIAPTILAVATNSLPRASTVQRDEIISAMINQDNWIKI